MRKRMGTFIAGIAYVCILVSLLVVQIQYIGGRMEQLLAAGLACILAIPTVLLFRGYIRHSVKQEPLIEKTLDYETFMYLSIIGLLSNREKEVAWLLYRNYSYKQIAEELYIAETTVKKHANHIYEKMKLSGKKELQELCLKSTAQQSES